jgi:hypothetical protein
MTFGEPRKRDNTIHNRSSNGVSVVTGLKTTSRCTDDGWMESTPKVLALDSPKRLRLRSTRQTVDYRLEHTDSPLKLITPLCFSIAIT